MSRDVFEKNVETMIRRAALRPDERRAKERFLRGLEAPEERKSWKLAAAAAAILMVVTILWSAKVERPVDPTAGQSTPPKPPPVEPWSGHPIDARGGNEVMAGEFVLRGRLHPPMVIFTGRTTDQPGPPPFPDGTLFHVRVHQMSEKLEAGRLVPYARETIPAAVEYRKGSFSSEWEYRGPVIVHVEVLLREEYQERDVAKALRIPEPKRTWIFDGSIWNQDVLWRLESQYPEAVELARELRVFVGRVEESCASEALFKSREKELVAEAQKIQSRASALGKKSLLPASTGAVEFAARDLAVSMPIFTWENGTFAGPRSYHTNNQLAKTYRGDPFGFGAYRRYLDEAVAAAGREFLLWILRDADVSGLEEAHRKLIRDHALKSGVEDFAQRLLQLPVIGADYPALEAELRVLKK